MEEGDGSLNPRIRPLRCDDNEDGFEVAGTDGIPDVGTDTDAVVSDGGAEIGEVPALCSV